LADFAKGPARVGALFNPALSEFVVHHADCLDYVAVIPDRNWVDHGPGSARRFEELPTPIGIIEQVARSLPVVMHSIGMSICSAGGFDEVYINQLATWRARLGCPWASDHLSFTRFGLGHESNAAVALAAPCDREILELIVPRVRLAKQRLGCPFLLENSVSYIRFPDEEMTEPEFLNTLVKKSGCGLLLDLHNVYTNARNHRFNARDFLFALEPDNVIEIHVAGGDEMMGFHTDSHAGPVLEGVWELLEAVAPRLRRLCGVTFEFHESSWPLLHDDGVLAQIERAREILSHVRPVDGDR